MKIKICGMKEEQNIAAIASLSPDYLGFIFYKNSPRYAGELSPDVIRDIPKSILKTGVFVNEELAKIVETIEKYDLNLVQLHGHESVKYCEVLSNTGIKISKAFSVDAHFDFFIPDTYAPYCQYFLFDTKSDTYGGSGKKFDWRILQGIEFKRPLFLSGGIAPEDTDEIKQLPFPVHAIDINSRFEISPGIKNKEIVQQFIKALQ